MEVRGGWRLWTSMHSAHFSLARHYVDRSCQIDRLCLFNKIGEKTLVVFFAR